MIIHPNECKNSDLIYFGGSLISSALSCLLIIGSLDNVPTMMQHITHTENAQTTTNQ